MIILFAFLYLLKILIFDAYLSNGYMFYGKRGKENWLLPLLTHSAINGVGTSILFFIISFSLQTAFLAFVWETLFHCLIDRTKAHLDYLLPKTTGSLIDQCFHLSAHLAFYFLICEGRWLK